MAFTNPYLERHQKLFENLPPDSALILPSQSKVKRNADAYYPFRQDSHFYYVSGWNEDKAVLVFLKKEKNQVMVFGQESTSLEARWEGARLGLKEIQTRFPASEVYPYSDLLEQLFSVLKTGIKTVYCPFSHSFQVKEYLKSLIPSLSYQESGLILNELRLIKDEHEIQLMRKAAQISAWAHIRAMKACKKVQFEYELEAELLYEFTRHGAKSPAYTSIVGSGDNACVLHYTNNDGALQKGDLILIDAGAEYQNYAADITRVFPVNGTFSEPQKIIYELVLQSQLAAIALARPNARFEAMQEVIVDILGKRLVELGIIQKASHYQKYYMHKSGHWLGLDVHDVGEYYVKGSSRLLQPGMVLTVEPGLYFPKDDMQIEAKWRGIGVRIEDDILITLDEPEVLSKEAPKTVEAIEQLMQ